MMGNFDNIVNDVWEIRKNLSINKIHFFEFSQLNCLKRIRQGIDRKEIIDNPEWWLI